MVWCYESGFDSDFTFGLVILLGEKHKVVGGTSLELLVGNGVVVLGVVFTDTGIISAHNQLRPFLKFGFEGSMGELGVSDHHRFNMLIFTGTGHSVVVTSKSLRINAERPTCASLSWTLLFRRIIGCVV